VLTPTRLFTAFFATSITTSNRYHGGAAAHRRRMMSTVFNLYMFGSLITGNTVLSALHAYGVIRCLEYEGKRLQGKNVARVEPAYRRSQALMLMQRDANPYASVNAKTRDLAQFTLRRFLVVAAGYRPDPAPIGAEPERFVIDGRDQAPPDAGSSAAVDF